MHAETLRAVGTCRNSFGPCALDSGPSTPVMTNWAFGYRSPSIAMNGIDPPMPQAPVGRPKWVIDASSSAVWSQRSVGAAFQPGACSCTVSVTVAPDGGSVSTAVRSAATGS